MGAIAENVELLNGMKVEELEQMLTDVATVGLGDVFNSASKLGITGLGIVTGVASLIGYYEYDRFITGQIKELQKMNDPNITETEKQSAIDQLKQIGIDNLNNFNISLRNLNDLNGYINSNTQTTQYIPSLSVSNFLFNFWEY
jgi:hypothetical protein